MGRKPPPLQSLRLAEDGEHLRMTASNEMRPEVLEISRSMAHAEAYAGGPPTTDHRHVKLFRNGRNQAVRIPVEFELPGDEAIMHRDGDRLVLEPVRKRGLLALLDTMEPFDEPFPDIDESRPQLRDVII